MKTTIQAIEKMRALPQTAQPLGLDYTPERSIFRVWAPMRDAVSLLLYESSDAVRRQVFAMSKDEAEGVFTCEVPGDQLGKFYNYQVENLEVTDPYSISASLNSTKSAIIDIRATDPEGFRESGYVDVHPKDAILYELNVKDFTGDRSSENFYRGKFLAFTQMHTEHRGAKTGMAHLKDFGVTHLHLLPVYDFLTVDERSSRFDDDDNYNWGYDPELYNVPEGSYSIRPEDPSLRIYELKRLIQSVHDAGMGVIVDVVYNHTYRTDTSNFNVLAPKYYHRQAGKHFSNGSGCGNEFASDFPMGRKFIIDSLLYWQDEYKVDGFRFDLMALLDRETIDEALFELRKKNPNVLIYGEPWTALGTPLAGDQQVLWTSQNDKGFALFNDKFRNALRGDNDGYAKGYVQGNTNAKLTVEIGMTGWTKYDEVHCGDLANPWESINYFNAHDNLIFQDKLVASMGDVPEVKDATKLAFGLLMTAQGIPFFHAGNEFMRSKRMHNNSYNQSMYYNGIDWEKAVKHPDVIQYLHDAMQLRKDFEVFRLATGAEVKERMHFIDPESAHLILIKYDLDEGKHLIAIHNNAWVEKTVDLGKIKGEIGADHIRLTKIFDARGRIEESVDDRADSLTVDRISTTIYLVDIVS